MYAERCDAGVKVKCCTPASAVHTLQPNSGRIISIVYFYGNYDGKIMIVLCVWGSVCDRDVFFFPRARAHQTQMGCNTAVLIVIITIIKCMRRAVDRSATHTLT